VLWYSESGKPDLGGHEDRDFRIYFQEELDNPEFIEKGFYRTYSVELDVSMLAVNTILQSEYLKDFEDATAHAIQYQHEDKKSGFTKVQGASGLPGVTGEFDNDLDEFVTCAGIFKKLRELINLWLKDVLRNDQYADNLITHLFRWLTTPQESKLYDPLLHRLVHKLMKKNFQHLIYRLRLLGCKIVYASFHKIIIHTERTTFDEAENFINFVLHTIKQNPMFAFLNVQPTEYWSILLFKDLFNYGGIKET
jgi:DNA polymerase epsilon subunit 1